MEKRICGIILTVFGIAGLIWTGYNFVQGNAQSEYRVKSFIMYGVLGLIFLLAGVGLIRIAKDHSA
ncbi:MAG: hypothetical protein C5B59_04920 [Bacteroidetes bacterium]|nr:MAG: hypothetical protein C5B59_04920 [Bacteroidota bacterium]